MKNKFNLTIVFLIFIFITLGCSQTENQQVSTTEQPSPPRARAVVSNLEATITQSNSPSDINSSTKTEFKSATVITGAAGLRQTASKNGKEIQTLPLDTKVEIIRQKGAWFFVRALGQTGWVHGNAIRLAENTSTDYAANTSSSAAPSRTYRKPSSKAINTTGASARCADGTLSYSRNRRGTCSHHGGVAEWF